MENYYDSVQDIIVTDITGDNRLLVMLPNVLTDRINRIIYQGIDGYRISNNNILEYVDIMLISLNKKVRDIADSAVLSPRNYVVLIHKTENIDFMNYVLIASNKTNFWGLKIFIETIMKIYAIYVYSDQNNFLDKFEKFIFTNSTMIRLFDSLKMTIFSKIDLFKHYIKEIHIKYIFDIVIQSLLIDHNQKFIFTKIKKITRFFVKVLEHFFKIDGLIHYLPISKNNIICTLICTLLNIIKQYGTNEKNLKLLDMFLKMKKGCEDLSIKKYIDGKHNLDQYTDFVIINKIIESGIIRFMDIEKKVIPTFSTNKNISKNSIIHNIFKIEKDIENIVNNVLNAVISKDSNLIRKCNNDYKKLNNRISLFVDIYLKEPDIIFVGERQLKFIEICMFLFYNFEENNCINKKTKIINYLSKAVVNLEMMAYKIITNKTTNKQYLQTQTSPILIDIFTIFCACDNRTRFTSFITLISFMKSMNYGNPVFFSFPPKYFDRDRNFTEIEIKQLFLYFSERQNLKNIPLCFSVMQFYRPKISEIICKNKIEYNNYLKELNNNSIKIIKMIKQ